MALVPVIQPPIIRALTTKKERLIKMDNLREVSKTEKILFPIVVTIVTVLIVPSAGALIGCLMLGNLVKESGVVPKITETLANTLLFIVTILLGVCVQTADAATFLTLDTIVIFILVFSLSQRRPRAVSWRQNHVLGDQGQDQSTIGGWRFCCSNGGVLFIKKGSRRSNKLHNATMVLTSLVLSARHSGWRYVLFQYLLVIFKDGLLICARLYNGMHYTAYILRLIQQTITENSYALLDNFTFVSPIIKVKAKVGNAFLDSQYRRKSYVFFLLKMRIYWNSSFFFYMAVEIQNF